MKRSRAWSTSSASTSPQFAGELMQLKTKEETEAAASGSGNFQSRDDLYEAAVDVVIRERRGSCSLLQRALGIGYGRAARLIDFMAEDGIVGQYNGSQARDVMISIEDWESRQQGGTPHSNAGAPAVEKLAIAAGGGASKPRALVTPADRLSAAVPSQRRNKIVPEPDEPSELEDEEEEDETDESEEAPWEDDESEESDEEDDVEEDHPTMKRNTRTKRKKTPPQRMRPTSRTRNSKKRNPTRKKSTKMKNTTTRNGKTTTPKRRKRSKK